MDTEQRIEVLEREIIELKKQRSMIRQQMNFNNDVNQLRSVENNQVEDNLRVQATNTNKEDLIGDNKSGNELLENSNGHSIGEEAIQNSSTFYSRQDYHDGYYLGQIIHKDGEVVLHGYGLYQFWNKNEYYFGQYVLGYRTGKGQYYWEDGRWYDGDYLDDFMSGQGVYCWPDGRRYEGGWKDDKMSGFGVYYFSNGQREEGMYENDEPIEEHTIYYPNGKTKKFTVS